MTEAVIQAFNTPYGLSPDALNPQEGVWTSEYYHKDEHL